MGSFSKRWQGWQSSATFFCVHTLKGEKKKKQDGKGAPGPVQCARPRQHGMGHCESGPTGQAASQSVGKDGKVVHTLKGEKNNKKEEEKKGGLFINGTSSPPRTP